MRSPIVSLVALAALNLAPNPALAAEQITMRVSYADLDLTRDDGIAELKARADAAAEAACAPAAEWVLSTATRGDCAATLKRMAFAEIDGLLATAAPPQP